MNIKKCFLALAPESVLQVARKLHYGRLMRSVSESYDLDGVVIKHLVGDGNFVIDLGAHVGIFTKYVSDLVGPNGRVFSVEPFPLNFDVLRSNVRKLKLENVNLLNCAVSDKVGRVTMEVPRFAELGESFYDARFAASDSNRKLRRAEADVSTIDTLFLNLPCKVTFVKCDVEGQELEALRGGINLIKKDAPAFLVEISLMDDAVHRKVYELLNAEGYHEYWFDGKKLTPWKPGDRPINAFFLKSNHMQILGQAGLT